MPDQKKYGLIEAVEEGFRRMNDFVASVAPLEPEIDIHERKELIHRCEIYYLQFFAKKIDFKNST